MAKKKASRDNRINKRASSLRSQKDNFQDGSDFVNEVQNSEQKSPKKLPLSVIILPFVIAILALILWKNKGLIVAATVNNQPIWRWNLEKRLNERYGTQTIEEMINEQIIINEANKKGVNVTDNDIKFKTAEIEKSLQGKISLNDALTQQGMTMDDFRRQLRIQLLIEKLTASSVGVSDEEVNSFIEKNRDQLTASDEAGLKAEAKNVLLKDKQSQSFQDLFKKLKDQAKVTKFL